MCVKSPFYPQTIFSILQGLPNICTTKTRTVQLLMIYRNGWLRSPEYILHLLSAPASPGRGKDREGGENCFNYVSWNKSPPPGASIQSGRVSPPFQSNLLVRICCYRVLFEVKYIVAHSKNSTLSLRFIQLAVGAFIVLFGCGWCVPAIWWGFSRLGATAFLVCRSL